MIQSDLLEAVDLHAIRRAYRYMGYAYFTSGDYNLNIFGIRANDYLSNYFNDVIGITYLEKGKWVVKKYTATTDPGLYYRLHPMHDQGTAIIVPGQYRGVYQIGLHQGKYEALVQRKPMKYWRDSDLNSSLDFVSPIISDMANTNLHRATNQPNGTSKLVDKWSAGCQCLASYNDFDEFMTIARRAKDLFGNSFTYTLFTEDNFFLKSTSLFHQE